MDRLVPTLFIGLGGTGREVLLRLRKRLFEVYGSACLPGMAHLSIDVDDNDSVLEGKPSDYLPAAVRLAESEKLVAAITPGEFQSYFDSPAANPHVFSWIYPAIRRVGSVRNGARALRPLGRLCFFHHSAAIRRWIVESAAAINSPEARGRLRTEYGIEMESGLRAVLVFSVAGGTGSGMFLDLAFMLRHLGQTRAISLPESIAYLLLPEAFGRGYEHEYISANGYAALKELEYYSRLDDARMPTPAGIERREEVATGKFVVNWDNEVPVSIFGPPFDYCYLVGNAAQGGVQLPPGSKGDLFDLVAEGVTREFAGDVASARRTLRTSQQDCLKNVLEYGYHRGNRLVYRDVFALCYSCFGLSKLCLPSDGVRAQDSESLAVRDAVDQLVTQGAVSLRPSMEALETGSALSMNQQEFSVLGLGAPRGDSSVAEQFRGGVAGAVARRVGRGTALRVVDHPGEEILFLTELCGLPLPYIAEIHQLRRAYHNRRFEFLHLDRHAYGLPELALRSPDEIELARRVHAAILIGVVLNIFTISSSGQESILLYVDRRPYPPVGRWLGDRREALDLLSQEPELLVEIEAEIAQRTAQLTAAQREQFYVLLLCQLLDGSSLGVVEAGSFAPIEVRVGETVAYRVPVENDVIRGVLAELETSLPQSEELSGPDAAMVRRQIFERWYFRRMEFGRRVRVGDTVLFVFRDPRGAGQEDGQEAKSALRDAPARDQRKVRRGRRYHSVFISYGEPDEPFARKLYIALTECGIDTFLFPFNAEPGERIHRVVRRGINSFDRVLLICSQASLTRAGVLHEIEETLAREAREGGSTILIPVTLDRFVLEGWTPPRQDLALAIRDRTIALFLGIAKDPEIFDRELERLLVALEKRRRKR